MPPPLCRCAVPRPATLLTVRKEGPNTGRQFYKCDPCNFFQWFDSSSAAGEGRDIRTNAMVRLDCLIHESSLLATDDVVGKFFLVKEKGGDDWCELLCTGIVRAGHWSFVDPDGQIRDFVLKDDLAAVLPFGPRSGFPAVTGTVVRFGQPYTEERMTRILKEDAEPISRLAPLRAGCVVVGALLVALSLVGLGFALGRTLSTFDPVADAYRNGEYWALSEPDEKEEITADVGRYLLRETVVGDYSLVLLHGVTLRAQRIPKSKRDEWKAVRIAMLSSLLPQPFGSFPPGVPPGPLPGAPTGVAGTGGSSVSVDVEGARILGSRRDDDGLPSCTYEESESLKRP